MKGINAIDLSQKIEDSIVLLDGKPIYCYQVGGDMSVYYYDMYSGNEKMVPFSEKITAPTARLGMVNIHGSVVYTSRMPMRRMRLGIGRESLSCEKLKVHYPDRSFDQHQYYLNKLIRPELADTLLGKFPSFQEACIAVRQEKGAVAFDRQFCVDSDGYVHYKTKKVGLVNKGKIVFATQYPHLYQLLKKDYESI